MTTQRQTETWYRATNYGRAKVEPVQVESESISRVHIQGEGSRFKVCADTFIAKTRNEAKQLLVASIEVEVDKLRRDLDQKLARLEEARQL